MSMDKSEPAIPNVSEILGHSEGLTKREWFAGMALMGRMARNSHYPTWEDAAKDAYEVADAMLAEGSAEQ